MTTKSRKGLLGLAAALSFVWNAALPQDLGVKVIKLDSGLIMGEALPTDPQVEVYKGIPFAAPPVGDLRWKEPQPVKPWDGVRACTSYGKSCPQNAEPLRRAYGTDIGPMSEDCLYLNVWTAAKGAGEKRPVMFWIHGGGNTMGSGSTATYDGTALAKKGVVLVTINYRLGPFGFFAHPLLSKESEHHSSGNYGLLDQVAALQWVKRNIAALGGDPGNVTIFGESAGAVDVDCLMASPLAAGLFHRAIAESGSAIGVIIPLRGEGPRGSAEKAGERLAKDLGCDGEKDPLAAMRAKGAEEIIKVANPGITGQGNPFGPVVDGWILPMAPVATLVAGRGHDVPFMTGTNANEGSIFLPPSIPDVEGYRNQMKERFGENAEKVMALYPVKEPGDVRNALERIGTDQRFVAGARVTVRAAARKNPKTFLYQFTRVRPGSESRGSFHGLEIAYIFGTLSRGGTVKLDETDQKLCDALSNYWVQFAKTGDPNGGGLPAWPAYTAASDAHLELGDKIEAKKGLRKEACDLFESLLAAQAGTRRGS